MGTLRIELFNQGMTILHRVGLAGLWMTLETLKSEDSKPAATLRASGEWQCDSNAVELRWQGDGKAFFDELFRASFRLTDDGRIWLTGLGHPNRSGDLGVTLQGALLSTYLQHGQHRKAESQPSGALVLTIEDKQLPVRYRKITWYRHQKAQQDFSPDRPIAVKGWLFPGGAVRHSSYEAATSLAQPPGHWLALLYAPVATFYFSVRRPGTAIRPSYCLVLAEPRDLADFARLRRKMVPRPVSELLVSGSADAALRILVSAKAQQLREDLPVRVCQVITYGKVDWVQAQQVRVDVFDAEVVSDKALDQYELLRQALPEVPDRQVRSVEASSGSTEDGEPSETSDRLEQVTHMYLASPVLDLAARNLVKGRPWWKGFGRLVTNPLLLEELLRHNKLLVQSKVRQGGLSAVVSDRRSFEHTGSVEDIGKARAGDPSDRRSFEHTGSEAIVLACHEAWRRRLGQLREEAKRGRFDFNRLREREWERWRVALAGCRNLAALRATLVNFWSRAGAGIPAVQRHWRDILPYLTEDRWQEARDLALLALVSYGGKEDSKGVNPDEDIALHGEEDER